MPSETVTALCQRVEGNQARFGAPVDDWLIKSRLSGNMTTWPPQEGHVYEVNYSASNGKKWLNSCVPDADAPEPEIVTRSAEPIVQVPTTLPWSATSGTAHDPRGDQIRRQWAINATIAYLELVTRNQPEIAGGLLDPAAFEHQIALFEHYAVTGSWEP